MNRVLKVNFDDYEWQQHPHLAGVATRFVDVAVRHHPVIDAQIARLDAAESIPWHVHEQHGEMAFVLAGSGWLLLDHADADQREAMTPQSAFFIAPGLWHAVQNNGSDPLIIFAVHTEHTERIIDNA